MCFWTGYRPYKCWIFLHCKGRSGGLLFNLLVMTIRAIFAHTVLVIMIAGISTSCQKEYKAIQQQQEKELRLKAALNEELTLDFPEFVMPNTDFNIGVATGCGHLKVERAYVMAEDGSSKSYKGLRCNDIPENVKFEQIGVADCNGANYTENWPEFGTYLYRVTLDPEPRPGSQSCATCSKDGVSEVVSDCFEVRVCRIACAFGGNKIGEGSEWWHIFDTELVAKAGCLDWEQNISAEGNIVIGKIIYDGLQLKVDLNDGWTLLQGEDEPVKVAGFGVEPKSKPSNESRCLYKGSDLTLDLSALKGNGLRYYAIHLDVQTANPEYF